MDNLIIRIAMPEDLDEIFAIESSVEDSWSYELVSQDLLENKYSEYIVGTYAMEYYPRNKIMGFTLEVREDNYPAIALYKKMGFISVGMRKGYYKNNKDAFIMWKMIEE